MTATVSILALGAAVASGNTVGLLTYEAGSFEGYTLFNPNSTSVVYMIDNYGRVVHTWDTDYTPLDFFAGFISGAQRLANGNTLVCSGPMGLVF